MRLKDFGRFNNKRVMSTMHYISADDSGEDNIKYMTESDAKVINFDVVKREYMNSVGLSEDEAKSVDGLFQAETVSNEDDAIYMVEFKNGNIVPRDIERKARDSVLIFQSITNTQIEDTRANVRFVLVYNSNVHPLNYRDRRAFAFASKGKEDFCRFGLAHLRGFCFKGVFAYDQNEFEKIIIPLIDMKKR